MPMNDQQAYLGMYDFPALHPAQEAWWVGLKGHFQAQGFSNIPVDLNRSDADPYDIWQAPNLFFAQTCGFPLIHKLEGQVQLLGTPCYEAPGCEGAYYRSLFIARTGAIYENLSAALPARIALNGMDSFSGWRVLRDFVDGSSELVVSGSHAKSIDLVREGRADIAAIDCVTHALISDVEPERLVGTQVFGQSPLAPGLPYITRADLVEADVKAMTRAVKNAFEDSALAAARRSLRLTGFSFLPLSQYVQAMT